MELWILCMLKILVYMFWNGSIVNIHEAKNKSENETNFKMQYCMKHMQNAYDVKNIQKL